MKTWLIVVLGVVLAGITYAAYEIEIRGTVGESAETVATGIKSTSAQSPESIKGDAEVGGKDGRGAASDNEEINASGEAVESVPPQDTAKQVAALPSGQAVEAKPEKQTPVEPTFDVVSVDPDGAAVIAGRAEPGASVTLTLGDRDIGTAQASERGEWVIVPDEPLRGGTAVLALRATPDGRSAAIRSSQTVTVVLPETESAAPGKLAEAALPGEAVERAEETSPLTASGEATIPPPDEAAAEGSASVEIAGTAAHESQSTASVAAEAGQAGGGEGASAAGAQLALGEAGRKPGQDATAVDAESAQAAAEATMGGSTAEASAEVKEPAEVGVAAVQPVEPAEGMAAAGGGAAGPEATASEAGEAEVVSAEAQIEQAEIEGVADQSTGAGTPSEGATAEVEIAAVAPPVKPDSEGARGESTGGDLARTEEPVSREAEPAAGQRPSEPDSAARQAESGPVAAAGDQRGGETGALAASASADQSAGAETMQATEPVSEQRQTGTVGSAKRMADVDMPAEAGPSAAAEPTQEAEGEAEARGAPRIPAEPPATTEPPPPAVVPAEVAVATAAEPAPVAEAKGGQRPIVVLSEPGKPSRLLQRGDDSEKPKGPVTFESVDYDDAGQIVLAGRTGPGADVRAYIDNQLLGDARADARGEWALRATRDIEPGAYELRVDQIDSEGLVIARVAAPFERAEPDIVAKARSRGQVVIQPGDNLWNLARSIYGTGTQYTVIYNANTNQIIDPDLIYPGQVLVTPGGAPPENAVDGSGGTAG